ERPWGNDEKAIEKNANKIFDEIIKKNQETFDLLNSELKDKFSLPVEPERIYVPGNHDRLCNKYQSLREKVCKWLRITPCDLFEHHFKDTSYGVYARHGHEYDKFNYEGDRSYKHEDYMEVPIGDPITTELIAKIPWKIMKRKEIKERLSRQEQEALKRNLQEIENVRPFSATLDWLLYQVKSPYLKKEVKKVIENAVDEVIQEFNDLKFVKRWYKLHKKCIDFCNEANKMKCVLLLLEKGKIFSLEKIMPLLKLKRYRRDYLLEAAPKEYSHLDNGIRYIVYGHTHEPLQVPLKAEKGEQVYLNTGTWRKRYLKCKKDIGFIGWKTMHYIIFYRKEEKNKEFPTFETWTGTLKDDK
ncbi:MAG: hypothetical protein D6828_03070, partial [Nitrospirae bacterium]